MVYPTGTVMASIQLPTQPPGGPSDVAAAVPLRRHWRVSAWLQATPLTLTFILFFLVPLLITLIVSFWDFNEYQIIPAFTFKNYAAIFDDRCLRDLQDLLVDD